MFLTIVILYWTIILATLSKIFQYQVESTGNHIKLIIQALPIPKKQQLSNLMCFMSISQVTLYTQHYPGILVKLNACQFTVHSNSPNLPNVLQQCIQCMGRVIGYDCGL